MEPFSILFQVTSLIVAKSSRVERIFRAFGPNDMSIGLGEQVVRDGGQVAFYFQSSSRRIDIIIERHLSPATD
jgi:hypothetical protein